MKVVLASKNKHKLVEISKITEKFGFELKEEVKVPNTDLTLYAMLRTAKLKEETT